MTEHPSGPDRRLRILATAFREARAIHGPSKLNDRELDLMTATLLNVVRSELDAKPEDPSPPRDLGADWDSTGDPGLDGILRALEERIDPELAYVPLAGTARRRPEWKPA